MNGLTNALTRHWELKLLSLVLAIAFWLFVTTSEKASLFVEAAVEFYGVPEGLEVVTGYTDSVEVEVEGLRRVLSRLGPDDVRVRLSLAGARPGETAFRLVPEQIMVPPGMRVVRVNPARVRVTIGPNRAAPPAGPPRPPAPGRGAGG
jgi:YbbR domain-containing protein